MGGWVEGPPPYVVFLAFLEDDSLVVGQVLVEEECEGQACDPPALDEDAAAGACVWSGWEGGGGREEV